MSVHKYPTWIRNYEDIQLFMGGRYLELVKQNLSWMSNKKYPLISSAYKTYSGILRKLDVNKVSASSYIGSEYNQYADNYETLVRFTFNQAESKEALQQIIDEGLLIGNAYAEVTWKEEETKVLVKATKTTDG